MYKSLFSIISVSNLFLYEFCTMFKCACNFEISLKQKYIVEKFSFLIKNLVISKKVLEIDILFLLENFCYNRKQYIQTTSNLAFKTNVLKEEIMLLETILIK